MTARHHAALFHHLFPGDSIEAVAVALCGRSASLDTELLLVHKLELVPYELCKRYHERIDWPPTLLEAVLQEAAQKKLAIVKIHSHPNGYDRFSDADDISDLQVFESIYGWIDGDRPHGSAIMFSDGHLRARAVLVGGEFNPIDSIEIVGDDIRIFNYSRQLALIPAFAERHAQIFGDGTTILLSGLRVAVVGCSGTGSPVIEQLARLGVGELVLVDPDHVEERNLNRIIGATMEDARERRLKVEVVANHIERIGLGTRLHMFPTVLEHPDAIRAVATADLVVGCMDGLSGRHRLSRLARCYVLPYVDVGVKLEALEDGTINQVAGSIHYLQPDGLDFLDRGVFSAEALEAEDLWLTNPDEYLGRREQGYVRGVQVDRPAVISVNMCLASLAVNEMLARLHPFRMDNNSEFGTTRLSLSHSYLEHERDGIAPEHLRRLIGRGDVDPLLGMPGLIRERSPKT
ncbi:MAG: ThiF family adenylyltransferase [Desulfomonilia bacterium]